MEIALESAIPTYAGGLGVLAGDTLRAAADSGVPVVGISLLYRHGYFSQKLDRSGTQIEGDQAWSPDPILDPVEPLVEITLRGRTIRVRAWRYLVHGHNGDSVPVFLLDTDLPENDERDRTLTEHLYGGEDEHRLTQEAVLGFGGFALLQGQGYSEVGVFHMNEGHSALLGLAMLEDSAITGGNEITSLDDDDIELVRRKCVFTTHTPVPAGHDKFPVRVVQSVLGPDRTRALQRMGALQDAGLNMTSLALFFSRYVNGVSMRHEQVSEGMFPNYPINSITNGVHATTWTSDSFRSLFDRHISQWRVDNGYLRYVIAVPPAEIRSAHMASKRQLLDFVSQRTGQQLDSTIFTIGFGRRATPYKRADLVFYDVDRLRAITARVGPVQFIFGGKAHPKDTGGKEIIRHLHELAPRLGPNITFAYVPDYDMDSARLMCAGVDLWLNTPHQPFEASGTSGMKAALNGVPSLSVLDGWWVEGCIEGVTGWSIGGQWTPGVVGDAVAESNSLYEKLELLIMPMYYTRPDHYVEIMRSAIALNGSYYTAQRMFDQYQRNAYRAVG